MKQILLASALILAPVAAFTVYKVSFVGSAQADASLGDLSPMIAIITDVQKIAQTGDFAAASTRITDYESAWDAAASGMRPLNPDAWVKVDVASDTALKSLRAATPTADTVIPALTTLLDALNNPTAK